MRKICIIAIFFITLFRIYSFESTLINFDNLDDTTVDFAATVPGAYWTTEEIDGLTVSLNPRDWFVRVNASSWTTVAREKTYIIPVTNSLNYPDETLLGVRIYFPERYANSHATIVPPFPIPSFYEDKTRADGMGTKFVGKGVVRNVGVLRKVSVRYLGNNFKYLLYVCIENEKGVQKEIFIGYLDFIGWRTKSWLNPHIEHELKIREAYKKARPYYPDEYPFVKFIHFRVYRSDPQITGNFVTMIKDVKLDYDEAFLEVGQTEYLQEDIFGIYKEELLIRAEKEMRDVHKRLFLEWQENKKQHAGVVTTRDKTVNN